MSKLKSKKVFLSGPMTGIEHYNVDGFAKAHAIVKKCGARKIYNPAFEYLNTDYSMLPFRSHDYWMRLCINELTGNGGYDAVVMLPNWEFSDGARIERNVALACGIDVYELREIVTEADQKGERAGNSDKVSFGISLGCVESKGDEL